MSTKRNKEPLDFTKIIKVVDPLIQTFLIIVAVYFFDKKGKRYQLFQEWAVQWQLFSLIAHYFISFSGKKKVERYILLGAMLAWYGTFKFYFKRSRLHEMYGRVILGAGSTKIGLFESVFNIVWLVIVIWYFFVCTTEIQALMRKRRKSKR